MEVVANKKLKKKIVKSQKSSLVRYPEHVRRFDYDRKRALNLIYHQLFDHNEEKTYTFANRKIPPMCSEEEALESNMKSTFKVFRKIGMTRFSI